MVDFESLQVMKRRKLAVQVSTANPYILKTQITKTDPCLGQQVPWGIWSNKPPQPKGEFKLAMWMPKASKTEQNPHWNCEYSNMGLTGYPFGESSWKKPDSILDIYPRQLKTYVHTKIYAWMFMSIIHNSPKCKQPNVHQLKKMCYIHTME